MFKLDFGKVGDLATLIKAGMSLDDIKRYAEIVETSPNIDANSTLEDIKAEDNNDSFELPKEPENKENTNADPINILKDLVK